MSRQSRLRRSWARVLDVFLRSSSPQPPRRPAFLQRQSPQACRLRLETLEDRYMLAATFPEFVDPHPAAGNQFGATVLPLSTGNVVITSPGDDAGGADAGAVYLFNGATGALISTLTGSHSKDRIGAGGVTALANGNFVVCSPHWGNGTVAEVGAVTFGNGSTGINGVVSAANSLLGSTANDQVGVIDVVALANGNYVVRSPWWDNGTVTDAGAVTFGSGTTGVCGVVSATNSLVGSTAHDNLSRCGVLALANSNYLVLAPDWDNGAATDAGAVTFGSGTTGICGVVSAANSLVGSTAGDRVGYVDVRGLANGNYVVRSPWWDNGAATDAGAVTFGSGTTGVSGVVSAANSLVGSTVNDKLGNIEVTALANGNYLVCNPEWDNGEVTQAGAVTFADGTTGICGVVSAANSLVGSTTGDQVGYGGVKELANGNYVVISTYWNNGTASRAGAVTFASGTSGVCGVVSAANSLIGSTTADLVGSRVTTLTNGNYVVCSPSWRNGTVNAAGAATFGSGVTGVSGVVSAANSLVGSSTYDSVGHSVTALTNGNYVVCSSNWHNGTAGRVGVGAVTFANGTSGICGLVSTTNSLVGSTAGDFFGVDGVTALANGNYVVCSPYWDNGTQADVGAVTVGSGTTGVCGVVSAANSLVGSTANDHVGLEGVTALVNGSFVVCSPEWDNGTVTDAGAVTFGSGVSGVCGAVSEANSLIGGTAGDRVGHGRVTALPNGNYVVRSLDWHNGTACHAGAVTFGYGTIGVTGIISQANSLVGSAANDGVGDDLIVLANGNYLVQSPYWDNGTASNAGAVTFGNGSNGVCGVVSAANSLVGSTANDLVGYGPVTKFANANYVVCIPDWDNGTLIDAGAVTFGSGWTGIRGVVGEANSLVGLVAVPGRFPITPHPWWEDDISLVWPATVENTGRVCTDTKPVSVSQAVLGEVFYDPEPVVVLPLNLAASIIVDNVNGTYLEVVSSESDRKVRVGSQIDGINSAPAFTSPASFVVAENAAAVGTVDAAQPGTRSLSYSITAGEDAALFIIDRVTGKLAFRAAPDYENPQDAGKDNVYDLIVTVSDGLMEHDGAQPITVTVTDVNDPPLLSPIGDKNLLPQASLVFTAVAVDQDRPLQGLTFSLNQAALDLGMRIDAATGQLTWTPNASQFDASYQATITVTDGGSPALTDSETITIRVGIATTIVLSSDHASGLVYGDAVTFTATVSAGAGSDVPTGKVQFMVDGAKHEIPVTLAGGTASLLIRSLAAGSHSIEAVYLHDSAHFLESRTESALVAVVSKASATAAIRSSIADVSVYGQPVTFTATLTATSPREAYPGGTVAFWDGSRLLGSAATIGNVATFTCSTLARGTHSIRAVYLGDANWNACPAVSLTHRVQTIALEPDPLDSAKRMLAVGGTPASDSINVSYSSHSGLVTVLIVGGVTVRQTYAASDLALIALYGGEGKDTMRVGSNVSIPTMLFGGDGNDTLRAGSGPSVIVGGAGNDSLYGGSGRDLVIGGEGVDMLFGQGGDDVLVGAPTVHDARMTALRLLMAEWTRTDLSYSSRVRHLLGPGAGGTSGGLNGQTFLSPSMTNYDARTDYLCGGDGDDWYFSVVSSHKRDILSARTPREIATYCYFAQIILCQ